MKSIGLSTEEIHAILSKSIDGPKKISAEGVKDVIAEAIIENNKKIAEYIDEITKKK